MARDRSVTTHSDDGAPADPSAPPAATDEAASSEPGALRSALTGRKLVWAVLFALLGPLFVVVYGYRHPPPEPPPDAVPAQTATLPQVPDDVARAQLDRSTAANQLVRTLTAPTLVTPATLHSPPAAGQLPSLVLVPRPQPYTLAELSRTVPAAFGPVTAGQPLLVTSHIEVPTKAALVIDGETPQVALASSAAGFATIMSRGQLTVAGLPQAPVSVASRLATGAPDADVTDGRPFVLQSGGLMNVTDAAFDSLGFGTGTTSGVAWVGTGGQSSVADSATNRPTGTVTDSTFTHNQFGVYTHEAQGMHFSGNTFADNIEYGFDPHDFSNDFVVENNLATHNGKHGFIFSRGCENNVLRNNRSIGNVGHGLMIDDGRSQATADAQARVNPSNNNTVSGNIATDNGNNGVEVEGGTGNVVRGNQLERNFIGVRVKNDAHATVVDNTITDSVRYGVDVEDPNNQVPVHGNTISGSWGGFSVTTPTSAVFTDNTLHGINAPTVVNGVAQRNLTWLDHVVTFIRWNPVLLAWGLVLLFPLSMWVLRRLTPKRFYGRWAGVRKWVRP